MSALDCQPRLEQLHDEGTRWRNSLALNLTAQSSRGDSDDGNTSLEHTLIGVSSGADYRLTPKFITGLGLGYGRDVTNVGDNGTESRAKAYSVAAYGSDRPEPDLFVDGLAGYSSLDFDSKRYVISPFGKLSSSRSNLDMFTETGAECQDRYHVFSDDRKLATS